MGRATRGCGCAIAVLVVVISATIYFGYGPVMKWWKTKPPPPSGRELQVHILDVGPVNGDSILIVAPSGKTVLIDAGDTGKGKAVLEVLKRHNIQQIDYFIATHPHPDHIGAADEVFKSTKVAYVIDNGAGPTVPPSLASSPSPTLSPRRVPSSKKSRPNPVTSFYDDYKAAITTSGAQYEKATVGRTFDLGDGARFTLLGPSEPFLTKEQLKAGGNEPNANSIVVRLDYGEFSMLLPGDAEEQTEHRMLTKDLNLKAKVLKVSHHGSKYATSTDLLKRVQPEIAIISCGEWNRYGHPSQVVLDRLRAANVKLYRTDLQGEITVTTKGGAGDVVVKTAKEPASDVWAGRIAQKDDSSRVGFIAYGDFGPPPKPPKTARTR